MKVISGVQVLETAEEMPGFENMAPEEQEKLRGWVRDSGAAYEEHREEMLQMGVMPEWQTDEEHEENRRRLIELGFDPDEAEEDDD